MSNRRTFLKKISAGSALALIPSTLITAKEKSPKILESVQSLTLVGNQIKFKPLEKITIRSKQGGTVGMYDGQGLLYVSEDIKPNSEFKLTLGGALGFQSILLFDRKGIIIDEVIVELNTNTFLEDDGEFSEIFDMLHYTMQSSSYGISKGVLLNGKPAQYFSSWMQDHMYVLLGMRYFYHDLLSGVDIYTIGQREDGMLHDNYKHAYQHNGPWSRRFDYGNFVNVPEDPRSSCIFVRVPVENIAEFTYIEMVYQTWKVTGNTEWMKSKLDSMLKAVQYATTDPYRWSDKYQLLKRGYTIDIWDFQADEDARRAGNDIMRVYLDKTWFGIMYGDNVRMAASLGYLSEMLKTDKREEEARQTAELGEILKKRIDDLAWNGQFYTHHIPEDPSYHRDFGDTDTSAQVTISNSWALNHGITPEQSKQIIKTYQRIKDEMPESSPGEWYCCYPPFEKGFSADKWEYMNGGVSPIVAGELALGAFENGFEAYGVDILRRVKALADRTGNFIEGCYKGKMPGEPERSFKEISLQPVANCDIKESNNPKIPGWTNEGDNDLHEFPTGKQTFEGIPFTILSPESNGNKICLGLSGDKNYRQEASINVNTEAGSIYLLHTMGKGDFAGSVTIKYTDKSEYVRYIRNGVEIGGWWEPSVDEPRKGIPSLKVAWTGSNKHAYKVGVYVFGMNNPHPGKTIKSIDFEGLKDNTKWMILGVTLSDKPVFFMPSIVSTIPKHWAAAECFYALMEGLSGIKNAGVAFNKATVAPRWETAGKRKARVCAKYEASGGYVMYEYEVSDHKIKLLTTGNQDETDFRILIPFNANGVNSIHINGQPIDFSTQKMEETSYAVFKLKGRGVKDIEILLK